MIQANNEFLKLIFNIQNIFNITFNSIMAAAFLLCFIYILYSRYVLKNPKKHLEPKKLINAKKHFTFSIQAIAIILIAWITSCFIAQLTFKSLIWANDAFILSDLINNLVNFSGGIIAMGVIAEIIFISAKQARTTNTSVLIQLKKQLNNAFIGLVICLSIFLIGNFIVSMIEFFNKFNVDDQWNYLARIIVNYMIGLFAAGSLCFLAWNGILLAKANDDKKIIIAKTGIKKSIIGLSFILSTLLIGNFAIDFAKLFTTSEVNWSTWCYTIINYLIGIGIYICIIQFAFGWFNLSKSSANLQKQIDAKEHLKLVSIAFVILVFVMFVANLLIFISHSYLNYSADELKIDDFWYALANVVASFGSAACVAAIAFNAIAMSCSSDANKQIEAKRKVVISCWCLLGSLLIFAIANIMVVLVTTIL